MKREKRVREIVRFIACRNSFKILGDKPKAKEVKRRMLEFIDLYGVSRDDIRQARKLRRNH
jgi:hypothetical protein